MVKISELRTNQGNVDVEGTITELGNTRSFNKFGKELVVANAILKDDSGSIKLTLWNDDVNRFKEGDKIKILNGYVNEFQGEKQLTSGKFGRMEKVVPGITPNEPEEVKKPDKDKKISKSVEKKTKDNEQLESEGWNEEDIREDSDDKIEEELF